MLAKGDAKFWAGMGKFSVIFYDHYFRSSLLTGAYEKGPTQLFLVGMISFPLKVLASQCITYVESNGEHRSNFLI